MKYCFSTDVCVDVDCRQAVAAAEAYIQQQGLDDVQVEVETRTLGELQEVSSGGTGTCRDRDAGAKFTACLGRSSRLISGAIDSARTHTSIWQASRSSLLPKPPGWLRLPASRCWLCGCASIPLVLTPVADPVCAHPAAVCLPNSSCTHCSCCRSWLTAPRTSRESCWTT